MHRAFFREIHRVCAALGLTTSLLLFGHGASAIVQPTPGGIAIPTLQPRTTCSNNYVEICIDDSEGSPTLIDSQADALVAPETFEPTCKLTFKPLVKGGNDNVAFGWYNLKPDPAQAGKYLPPAESELFGILNMPYGAKNGADLAGLSVELDLAVEETAGRYRHGAIGFFLAAGGSLTLDPQTHLFSGTFEHDRIYYTQHALNAGSDGDATYYQVLTWQSIEFPNSFYFGWEDQKASGASDNDFDDLLFLVSGIQCSGGGAPCDTTKQGACARGTQQCTRGALSCVQNAAASAETCNAVDDDCNGSVDDGDLCSAGKVCDRGRCVPKCGTGEFRCAVDLVCSSHGVCIEASCAEKSCPAGQVCNAGTCIDSCAGVSCPYGQLCQNGGCVDPCSNIECDRGFSCVLGVCRSCECSACESGQICHENVCVDNGCETQSCAPGAHCARGACIDDCSDTSCPAGQKCSAGQCAPDPNAPSSGGEGGSGDSPLILLPRGGSEASAGGAQAASAGTSANRAASASGPATPNDGAGCACGLPQQRSRPELGLLMVLGALGLAGWRKAARTRDEP